jgi:hypothetical protein
MQNETWEVAGSPNPLGSYIYRPKQKAKRQLCP